MEEISITRDDYPNLFSLTNQLLNSGSYKTMLRVLASYDLQGKPLSIHTTVDEIIKALEVQHG